MPRTKNYQKKKSKTYKPRRYAKKHATGVQNAQAVSEFPPAVMTAATTTKFYVSGVSSNPRISTIASCYQEYRIMKVAFKFMPLTNTYGTAGGTGGYIHQLYLKTVNQPPPPGIDATGLASMGAKVHELTQKDFTYTFKPAVDMLAATGGVDAFSGVMIKKSPWLSTSDNADIGGVWAADSTPHWGLLARIQTPGGDGNEQQGVGYTAKVYYEFRKPIVTGGTSNVTEYSKSI
ncbi:MAG: putative capsid protein [Cressdnaviricota sp.]|nr:MAG: putative capsid protein [Cressdnaviricota sp.]